MPEITVSALPVRLQKQYENARTAVARENADYAINICHEILARHPGCLPVRKLLRATQLKVFRAKNRFVARAAGALAAASAQVSVRTAIKREPARALELAERALGADPTNTTVLRLLAEAALALELGETAVFALESAIEYAGENHGDLVRLAGAYIAAGRSPEALRIAERLLKEKPGDAEVLELVKRASVEQSIAAGRWDSGSGSYRDKLRDEQRAVSLEQSGKMVASEAMSARLIDEAIARVAADPDNINHYRTVVSGCQSAGRYEDALLWLGRARARPTAAADPTLEKWESELRLAQMQQRIDQRSESVANRGENLDADPELVRMRAEMSEVRIETLRSMVERFPNELTHRFELGRLYLREGQTDLAIQQFQVSQKNPALRTQSLALLGSCFMAKSLYDLAAQQFQIAKGELQVFDDAKKDVVYQLATCLEAMGRREQALEEYKAIYSSDIAFRDVAAKIEGSYSSPG